MPPGRCVFLLDNPTFPHCFSTLNIKYLHSASGSVQTIGRVDLRPTNPMPTNPQIQAHRAIMNRLRGTFKEADALPHSNCVVLSTEPLDRFEKLLSSLIEEFQPRTVTEQIFVETMAVARWRLNRNGTMQIELLKMPATSSQGALQFLLREKTALKRQYSRARRNFLDLRARKTCAAM